MISAPARLRLRDPVGDPALSVRVVMERALPAVVREGP